jgi:leucine dehydrogenase
MSADLSTRIQQFDGLGIVTRFDQDTGTWIFICLHDDSLGRMTGGTRMQHYARPADGLEDGMRLAQGMTHKWAVLGMRFGGAKAVLAIDHPLEGDERRGLLERYGTLIESLGGLFATGEDMGTTPEDFQVIATKTRHVHGLDPQTGEKIDPGPFTALGVYAGMRAAAGIVCGDPSLGGRTVLVQGAGNVGRRLIDLLHQAGARILVSDLNTAAAEAAAARAGGEVVPTDRTYSVDCDIYAPCAVGATLNAETIPQLQCRLIAGSANNQLAEAADAERLHARGIAYCPDYIINGGGAMAFGLLLGGETDLGVLRERMTEIGQTIADVLTDAAEQDESPVASADRLVERRLTEARDAREGPQ